MKILIAEDDPVSCRILERSLASWGHEALVATNAQLAWDVLREPDAPSLAILDIMMPELDGCEVCRRVRDCLSPFLPTSFC